MDGKTVDARGMLCPKPLILVKKALAEMAISDRLTVLLDNETACDNVRRFLQDHGCNPVGESADGVLTLRAVKTQAVAGPTGHEQCLLPKGGGAAAGNPGVAPGTAGPTGRPGAVGAGVAALAPLGGQPSVIVVNREWMGSGSEELGRLLLQSCLNTLKELEPLPAAVVFYNSGVRLACEGSPVLGALQELETRGVRLLVCGTCLDFFGLKPQVRVGTVSNMYDIMQTLATAGPVINP